MENRPKTIFCDIDGTLIRHRKPSDIASKKNKVELLPGVLEKLNEWDRKGYNIILTTGRKESLRKITIEELSKLGIIFDQLIMGIGGGQRVLINDLKEYSETPTAMSFNLKRNLGIGNVNI